MDIYKTIIIGAGPAGISCGIQLARYKIKTLILEKNMIGGLLKNANLLENYPGFPDGISGISLINKLKKHLKNLKISVIYEEVLKCDIKDDLFTITTKNNFYYTEKLIIASGTSPKKLYIKGIENIPKDQLFYEVFYISNGFIPSISTIAPKSCEKFFEKLIDIKNNLYSKGRFQLQFSIHTTNEKLRNKIIPVSKWDFKTISEYCNMFYKKGDRKITLNFALSEDFPLDPDILIKWFSPEKFLIKITPLNPTYKVIENKLKSYIKLNEKYDYPLIKILTSYNYDVIVSVGALEENKIGSNCGQYVNSIKNKKLKNAYKYKIQFVN